MSDNSSDDQQDDIQPFPLPTNKMSVSASASENWHKVRDAVETHAYKETIPMDETDTNKNKKKKKGDEEGNEDEDNNNNNDEVGYKRDNSVISRKWTQLMKYLSTTPSNTKSFFGVDNGKALSHWEGRSIPIINGNLIFGGNLKKKKVQEFIEDPPNKEALDNNDPIIMYNIFGDRINKADANQSVASIVYRKARNVWKKKRPKDERAMLRGRKGQDEQTEFITKGGKAVPVDNVEGPFDALTDAFKDKDRVYGDNFCDKCFDNFKRYDKLNEYEALLNSIKQHRPYFTYWITFVQAVVCIISLIAYGLAPIGFSYSVANGLVQTINLEKQLISYQVKNNFWIGPAVADLIHLGAKYAPCIRNDSNIYKAIQNDREIERQTACCIRNDRGGCLQASREECSQLLSKWHKWEDKYGSVCGLDPNFCGDKWAKSDSNTQDITLWPTCEKPVEFIPRNENNEHMTCELIGRPCCVGVQGECIITTREHCDFRKGYFHGEAHLCSQVDCMQGICGMLDFLNPKSPDQVYRLFTSLFVHAGLLQLLWTMLFHFFILRDVERLAGCLRVSIIYLASGIVGNLASAIFLPYQAEAGPSSSQFGILACVFVEAYHARDLYEKPCLVILKLLVLLLILFALGFLPMIDNYANIFGFISGLLLSIIFFPHIKRGKLCGRIVFIVLSAAIFAALCITLVVLFYIKPIDKCDWCKFLSCPFGSNICLNMDFNITRIRNEIQEQNLKQ